MITYDLSGKTALVTGANRGIGKAMADALEEAGAQVVRNSGSNNRMMEDQHMNERHGYDGGRSSSLRPFRLCWARCALSGFLACGLGQAGAEEFRLTRSDSWHYESFDSNSPQGFNWGPLAPNGPAPAPGNVYIVPNNLEIRSDNAHEGSVTAGYLKRSVFAGDWLQLGESTGSGAASFVTWSSNHMDAPDLRWVNSSIVCNDQGTAYFYGTNTLSFAGGQHHAGGLNAEANTTRTLCLVQTLICDEPDLVLEAICKNWVGTAVRGQLEFADFNDRLADLRRFKGRLATRDANSALAFLGKYSIPDYETFRADGITLADQTALVIGAAARQYATCGVTLAEGATATLEPASGSVTFALPVCGDENTVLVIARELRGANQNPTVTLANDWTSFHGTLVVSNCTVNLTSDAAGLTSVPIVVRSGGAVRLPHVGAEYDLRPDPGATISVDLRITYVPGKGTEPIEMKDVTAAGYAMTPKPIVVRLSEAIKLPVNDPLELPCLRLPAGLASAADFTDATGRTYGYPNSRFDVRPDAEAGFETVYLVVKPAVTLVISEADSKNFNPIHFDAAQVQNKTTDERRDIWSDGKAPQKGRDYLILPYTETHTADSWHETFDFPGDSLLLRAPFNTRAQSNHVERLVMDWYSSIWSGGCWYGNTSHIFTGTIEIAGGDVETPVRVHATGGANYWNGFDFRSTIEGGGWCSFRGRSTDCPNYLRGDNVNFTGGLMFETDCTAAYNAPWYLTNDHALGGARPTGNADNYRSVWLKGNWNGLVALETLTLDAANRGLYVSGTGCFLGAEKGKTLALDCPVRLAQSLRKTGDGTLALAREPEHGADGQSLVAGENNVLAVERGFVKSLGRDGYATMKLVFSEGAGIRLDAGAEGDARRYGLRLLQPDPIQALGPSVALSVEGALPDYSRTVAICSVPAGTADLLPLFDTWANVRALRLRSGDYVRAVVKRDDVTLADEDLVRYVVEYDLPSGLVFRIR